MNEALLESKLAELEKARAWSPRVVSKLEALLRGADPWALYRVSPVRFGAERGIDEREAIDLFVHAARAGLFELEWRMVCPSCGDTLESLSSLEMVQSRCSCKLCRANSTVNLDDYILVSFTVARAVRELPFHQPESLPISDYYYRLRLDPTGRGHPEMTKTQSFQALQRFLEWLEPGSTHETEFVVEQGVVVGHDLVTGHGWAAKPAEAKAAAPQKLELTLTDSGWSVVPAAVAPGPATLKVTNATGRRASLLVLQLPEVYASPLLTFPSPLTGNRLLNSQTFRSLYRTEVIGTNEGIGVKDLTLLFTDLKGSTELYERIGDLKAFALVQRHFDFLGQAVKSNGGAIVKTIGDAVMASFGGPADALKAALAMLAEIDRFNASEGGREIVLKVGIHRGASIAVTLNERIDYFGQTVNIAARVQGVADADEICVTRSVLDGADVAPLVAKLDVKEELASLKGIKKQLPVYRLRQRA